MVSPSTLVASPLALVAGEEADFGGDLSATADFAELEFEFLLELLLEFLLEFEL